MYFSCVPKLEKVGACRWHKVSAERSKSRAGRKGEGYFYFVNFERRTEQGLKLIFLQ